MNQANNVTRIHAGVDVSKKTLDCWKPATKNKGGAHRSFDNDGKGIRSLLGWLPKGGHVVLESTGPYGELLVLMCHDLAVPVSVVNPNSVRDLARAHGQRAKTDKIDAELIARFADAVQPEPLPRPTKAQMALRSHIDLRESLVQERAAHRCRLAEERNPAVRQHLQETIAHHSRTIAALEKQIDSLIASCPRMTAMRGELRTIPGIGPVISATLAALLPELGSLSRKQVAALCGLAPYARDSGARKGKRYIFGGRAKLRRCLYLGAVSAVRSRRTPLAAQHKAMLARGKEKKVSLIALARKLAIRANTLCKPFTSIPHANH